MSAVSLPPLPSSIDPALRTYLQAMETVLKSLPGKSWRIIEGRQTSNGPMCLLLQYNTGANWLTKKALLPDGTFV